MPSSKFLAAALGIAALTMGAALTPAAAAPAGTGLSSVTAPETQQMQQVQWRGHHGGYYRGYHGYRGGGDVAAGVLGGLALGAAVSGAYASTPYASGGYGYGYGDAPDDDWISYCSSKYRSFDPASGTYLGYDGVRHPCQ